MAVAPEVGRASYAEYPLSGTSVVSAIEIRSDAQNLPIGEMQNLILVEVGMPVSRDQVARSLRNLQASGLVSEAEVFIEPDPEGGERVIFSLRSRIQVAEIRLEGDLEVNRRKLVSVMEIGEAEPLLASRVLRSVYAMEEFYENLGFLEAQVRARPKIDETTKTAEVVFRIDPGRPFLVDSVDFEGSTGPFSAQDLRDRLKVKPGKRYRSRQLRTDTENLSVWLFDQEFRKAAIERPTVEIDWDTALVDLKFQVDVGPEFAVEVLGGDLRRLKKHGAITFMGWQQYDEALLLQSLSRIRRYYQERGHYDVEVDWTESEVDDLFYLVITVIPGPVYQLVEIGFSGNEAVGDSQLAALMGTTTRRLFDSRSGRLVDAAIKDDVENIRSYYRLQGHWDARVGPHEVSRLGQDAAPSRSESNSVRQLAVLIPVEEGFQRRTVDIVLEGTELPLDPTLRDALPLRPGGPFHPLLLRRAENVIRAIFDQQGYESAQISSTVDWDDSELLADVHIKILEGPQSTVDRVILRGNRRTDSNVIRHSLGLESGEIFNTDRLLQSQRYLYELGAFARVDVRRAPGTPFKGERDILVEIEEANRNRVSYGFGYDSENGASGILGYTRNNLWGRAVSSRLDLRLSQRDQLARLLAFRPNFGRFRLSLTGSLFYIEETRGNPDFLSRRRGGQIEVERVGDHARFGALYDYRWVRAIPDDPLLEEVPGLEREFENVRISSITPNYQIDHRDDPIDPTRGWMGGAQIEYAFPFVGAEEEFLKGFMNYSHYLNLGVLGVAAANFRIGGMEPISGTPTDLTPSAGDSPNNECPTDQPQLCIPISERFFSGGRTTHRAYRRDRLGIVGESLILTPPLDSEGNDELVAIGGNGLFLINLDYRFPIAGPVGGNVFVDTGNVWADWRNMDLSQLKTGAGIGVRYNSPVGLVRLDIGWKLDREPSEDPYVIFFSFGNPF